jgi:broad-specificity NMP kinase
MNILITGMSGTGKSTVMGILRARGFEAVDTDTDDWSEFVVLPDETEAGWVWREDRLRELLAQARSGPLFVSGCVSNQGEFYPQFDHVVLFTAPTPVLLERVRTRTNNPYGKTAAEQREILDYIISVEPLLRRGADLEVNTAHLSAKAIADQLATLAQRPSSTPGANPS